METNPGGGTPNPWAEYGLNADGTAIVKEPVKAADPVAAENAALKAKVGELEGKLSKITDDSAGLAKKLEVLDKIKTAVVGEDPKSAKSKEIWTEFKAIVKDENPALYRQIVRMEQNPNYEDPAAATASALAQARLSDLNTNAHQTVVGLAKGIFKGMSEGDLNEAVYPFEIAITDVINQNPQLAQRFVNGDMGVVRELFQRLVKPHVADRLRRKASVVRDSGLPKAPPKGAASAGAGEGETKQRPDLRTRQGKQDFHKAAVGRFFDKQSAQDE